jgi:hypothetical protein
MAAVNDTRHNVKVFNLTKLNDMEGARHIRLMSEIFCNFGKQR